MLLSSKCKLGGPVEHIKTGKKILTGLSEKILEVLPANVEGKL